MAIIDCWQHGIKVKDTTKCDHWTDKQCGDVPNCFFKTNVARYQFLHATHNPKEEVKEIEDDENRVQIDDAFF